MLRLTVTLNNDNDIALYTGQRDSGARMTAEEKASDLQWSCFVVDETPFCMWGTDIAGQNHKFLDRLNPDFFNYFIKGQADNLAGDDRQMAALMIRLAYSHSLETMFALLGAAIQAPHCPLGWLMQYQPFQLYSFIRKLVHGERVLRAKRSVTDWLSISNEIHKFTRDDASEAERIKARFADTWSRLAADFVDQVTSEEYNSIKHGFRAAPGGSSLQMLKPETGVPFFDSKSQFGSKFFSREALEGKTNFYLQDAFRNWSPVALAVRIELVVVSIGNLITYLKTEARQKNEKLRYDWPEETDALDLAWTSEGLLASGKGGFEIHAADISPKTAAEIRGLFTWDESEAGSEAR